MQFSRALGKMEEKEDSMERGGIEGRRRRKVGWGG
jgi:hypothetical protein